MVATNRKPHLLRVKQQIVALLDAEIQAMASKIRDKDPGFEAEDRELKREIAIFVRQRNKFAKDADVKPIELTQKDGNGKLIYTVE